MVSISATGWENKGAAPSSFLAKEKRIQNRESSHLSSALSQVGYVLSLFKAIIKSKPWHISLLMVVSSPKYGNFMGFDPSPLSPFKSYQHLAERAKQRSPHCPSEVHTATLAGAAPWDGRCGGSIWGQKLLVFQEELQHFTKWWNSLDRITPLHQRVVLNTRNRAQNVTCSSPIANNLLGWISK